jgi:hypothetical protein
MRGRRRPPYRRALPRALALLVGVAGALALYAVAEVAFRYSRYREITHAPSLPRVRFLSRPLVRFDSHIGFRYVPGTPVRQTIVDAHNRVEHRNTITVNAAGHISRQEDPVERLPDEYRIAVIGDSFTACVFNDVPWPDVLEDRLRDDRELLAALRRNRVRVMNFGMDGTGFAQWKAVYEHEVRRYRPDLVVVAFIENDIWREFRWMDTVPLAEGSDTGIVLISTELPVSLDNPRAMLARQLVASEITLASPDLRARAVRHTIERRIAALPWFGVHAELAATGLDAAGVRLPPSLRPRLKYAPDGPRPWMAERGLELAATQIRELSPAAPLILAHLPTRPEIESATPAPLSGQLRDRVPDVPWVSALEPLRASLGDRTPAAWFVPNNSHVSNEGARAYAEALHVALRPHLLARRPDAHPGVTAVSAADPAAARTGTQGGRGR